MFPARSSLDIYWIDVDGGAATLIVAPASQSILMDTGWNREDGSDAERIQAALRDAGGRRPRILHHFPLSRRPIRRTGRTRGARTDRPDHRRRRQRGISPASAAARSSGSRTAHSTPLTPTVRRMRSRPTGPTRTTAAATGSRLGVRGETPLNSTGDASRLSCVARRSHIFEYARSSRLERAVRSIDMGGSRCDAGFHHGLLSLPRRAQLLHHQWPRRRKPAFLTSLLLRPPIRSLWRTVLPHAAST